MGSNDELTTYGFLCGADMEPGKIRRNPHTAESRFVDIGSVLAQSVAGFDLPLPDADEIWGVVITLSQAGATHGYREMSVTLRSGKVVKAMLLTDLAAFGTPAEALAEAYYWELPRAWREALEAMRNEPV